MLDAKCSTEIRHVSIAFAEPRTRHRMLTLPFSYAYRRRLSHEVTGSAIL
jgi:hypothetical protein